MDFFPLICFLSFLRHDLALDLHNTATTSGSIIINDAKYKHKKKKTICFDIIRVGGSSLMFFFIIISSSSIVLPLEWEDLVFFSYLTFSSTGWHRCAIKCQDTNNTNKQSCRTLFVLQLLLGVTT